MDDMGFDVCFPSRAAWEKFVAKWKGSKIFYLGEIPGETSTIPTGNNSDIVAEPVIENIEVVEGEGMENEACGHLDAKSEE
ncbi:hypothetical protein J1N35_041585 [Gossypium stocksii]|uniref:Uncharacterized protein n=1 Tax=Gossypium stocksii TaxID=47602 RepID=A0A9D3UFS1_9ROSI|nr:hypothetical protein J1N35_041585 [Gossypium stocksii]